MNHFKNKWQRPPYYPPPRPFVSPITQAEIDEFRQLLRKAREYDRAQGHPNCETLSDKKEQLLGLAKELGADVSFIDEPPAVDAVDPVNRGSNG